MRNSVYLFTSLLFFFPAVASAQGLEDDQSLGEVVIHGDEEGGPSGNYPATHDSVAFTSVITSKELKGRKTTLPEVLQEQSGIEIRRYGGLDDFATVSIRGSTSEQVAVYLDGVPLNQGINGTVNIATIPTDQIERIEVYKGSAPIQFGSSSIGGVVNIITKKGPKNGGRETHLTQSYGSFKTYEGSLLHREKLGNFLYNVGYNFTRSSGDFSYLDDNGTSFNNSDDRIRTRRNNEFNRHNLSTDLEFAPGIQDEFAQGFSKGLSIGFQDQFFQEGRGIPGLATLTSDFARLATLRNSSSFEVIKRNLLSGLDLTLAPFFQYQKSQFDDPNGEIGLGVQDNDDQTFQYGSGLRGHWLAGAHQRWNLNLEYRGEQFLPVDYAKTPSSGPHSTRNQASASVEDEIFLFGEEIVLNPSIRSEHIFNGLAGSSSSSLHPVSGKIGIKYHPFKVAVFRTNFSRSYRVPNFSELFGDQGTFQGNPTLKPESSLNWDIGASWNPAGDPGPVHLEVSYFLNQIDDLIQLLQTSQYTVQAQNLSSARIQGVETTVSTTLFDHLDLSGNYTFQSAKDTSGLPGLSGKFLPGRPLHEAQTKASLKNRWGKLFTDMNLMSHNFLDTQNVLEVSDRFLWNAGASAKFLKRFTTTFEVKNIINNRVSDIVGFPLPGRSLYAKLEVDI